MNALEYRSEQAAMFSDNPAPMFGAVFSNTSASNTIAANNNSSSLLPVRPVQVANSPIRKPTPLSLLYGFAAARRFDSKDGRVKFTVDELNHALAISFPKLDADTLRAIPEGIDPKLDRIQAFVSATGIDLPTSKKLILSWSFFLRIHHNFVSVSKALKRKRLKQEWCSTTDIAALTAIKNNTCDYPCDKKFIRRVKLLFEIFIRDGDAAGFDFLAQTQHRDAKALQGIIKTIFFRRTSKLALHWSQELEIPVTFDINFNPLQVHQEVHNGYRPITFSEYKYAERQGFRHVTLREVGHRGQIGRM